MTRLVDPTGTRTREFSEPYEAKQFRINPKTGKYPIHVTITWKDGDAEGSYIAQVDVAREMWRGWCIGGWKEK